MEAALPRRCNSLIFNKLRRRKKIFPFGEISLDRGSEVSAAALHSVFVDVLPVGVQVAVLLPLLPLLLLLLPVPVKIGIIRGTVGVIAVVLGLRLGIVAAAAAAGGVFTTPAEVLGLGLRQRVGGIRHGLHDGGVFFKLGGISREGQDDHGVMGSGVRSGDGERMHQILGNCKIFFAILMIFFLKKTLDAFSKRKT